MQPHVHAIGLLLVLAFSGVGCREEAGKSRLSSRAEQWLDRVMPASDRIIEPWEVPTRFPDRVALTWSDDPSTTLSVTWRTDTSVAKGVAQIAPADPSPKFAETARTLEAALEAVDLSDIDGEFVRAHYHSVTFRALTPGLLYAYRVGDGEVWSAWMQVRTAPATPEPFSFVYFGDAQTELVSLWSRTIRAAVLQAPDVRFLVHAGDLVNRAHRNVEWGQWHEAGGWIFGMVPSLPVPGNHEYRGFSEEDDEPKLSALWRPQFTLPENGPPGLEETAYILDYPGLRLIGLNSNLRIEEQTVWLETVLSRKEQPWTAVTFHHPIFSSSGDRDNAALRAAWKPLFDRYRVDLVLQGHDHTYARGRDLNVPVGTNGRDAASGTVYVNSVSGPKMYETKENRWESFGAVMERAAENTQLFQIIHVDGDLLRFEAFTATGELYDAFELVKSEGEPNRFRSLVPAGLPERRRDDAGGR